MISSTTKASKVNGKLDLRSGLNFYQLEICQNQETTT